MRNIFDRELCRLRTSLLDMFSAADALIGDSAYAVRNADRALALKAASSDDKFDCMENSIEQMCINLIVRRQPLARDLRAVTASLKIITDTERIADLCADICETVSGMGEGTDKVIRGRLADMLGMCREMLAGVARAYKEENAGLARQVCRQDDAVDGMFSETARRVSASDMSASSGTAVMLIAKFSERIADHCTNIAEWVIFINDGVHPDLNPHIAAQDRI